MSTMNRLAAAVNSRDDVVGFVYKTKDYDKFGFLVGNRRINPENLQNIVHSIKSLDLTPHNPILVGGDFKVIEGQHRLEACRILGLPVHYIQTPSIATYEQILALNLARASWRIDDYIHHFYTEERLDYIDFVDDMARFNLESKTICMIVGIEMGTIRRGELKYGEMERRRLKEYLSEDVIFMDYPFRRTQAFIAGFRIIREAKNYKFPVMKKAVRQNPDEIKKRSTGLDAAKCLLNCYNRVRGEEDLIPPRRLLNHMARG